MHAGEQAGRMGRESKRADGQSRGLFSTLAGSAAAATGRPWAFALAVTVVATWALTGPLFGYSDTWQLVINTSTTIVTFLMVFLLQHAQNKDTLVLQVKLNELLAAVEGASNRLIDIEDLSEEEVEELHERYQRQVGRGGSEGGSTIPESG